MDRKILAYCFPLMLLTSIVLTAGTGFWLLLRTKADSCLGDYSMGVVFSVSALSLVLIICLGACSCGDRSVLMGGSCAALGVFVVMISFSFIAIIRSNAGFGSLQKEISGTEKWMNIKSCLYNDVHLCAHFQKKYVNDTAQMFLARHLTHTQSGCCTPPRECNFNFSSPTEWVKPENGTYSNSDCYEWNDDPKKLCYNCQACKHGFARDLKKQWTIAGVIVLIASLMIISSFAFMAVLPDKH